MAEAVKDIADYQPQERTLTVGGASMAFVNTPERVQLPDGGGTRARVNRRIELAGQLRTVEEAIAYAAALEAYARRLA